MIHPPLRHRQNATQEWMGALFTLLVLTGIYTSMDNFASYETGALTEPPPQSESGTLSSVAPPYWNKDLGYGFRSLAGDTYSSSGTSLLDTVLVTSSGKTDTSHTGIKVSYYKDTPIDQIDKSLNPESRRAYSRLPHGIAVIEGDIESASAKTIFSTLHSR